ncbi:hypothetical protein [Pseudoalteromonas sp. TB64]|uniref:hypothetical protein n=1 Tax=Pseudoalteromonas sp. TB64 TaxID=1938600 RepID=UPI00111143EF|nr:hypothetical protein [Pseudoalteromonas sp. TB64]
MKVKFKEFWSEHRLLLVTILTLGVASFGVYLILISAKSHVELWSAIGSWVGGVATVYAVCIAIIEYLSNKKLEVIKERTKIHSLITYYFAPKLELSELAFIRAKRSYESIVDTSEETKKDIKNILKWQQNR